MNLGKVLRMGRKAPYCPLCKELMVEKYESLRHIFIYACDKDAVAIAVDDPFVGKWDAAHEKAGKIECPACNADMVFFCTSTGFMKAKCPKKKCGCTVSSAEPDRNKQARVVPIIMGGGSVAEA